MLLERLRTRWSTDLKLRFLMVGVYNTAFGLTLFPIMFWLFRDRAHYLVLTATAHFLAVLNAFVAHRRVAFRARGPMVGEFLRFNLGYLGTLALGLGGMALLVGRWRISAFVAQPALSITTIALSYLWHSRVSFRASA